MRGGLSPRAIAALFVLGAVLVISGSGGGGTGPAVPGPPPTSSPVAATTAPPPPAAPTSTPPAPSAITDREPPPPMPEEMATELERTDRLERQVPLVRVLPHETPEYRIDYRPEAGGLVLVVTLMPVLNDADQLPAYRAQLATAKRAALEFLASQGTAPGAFPVEYLPTEAAEL